ncbi:MAG: xylulokinase, partial [Aggregatilineales bacterium]
MTILLAIDIGTSSAKAVLFDAEKSRLVGTAAQEYPIDKPAPGRAEQHPDSWWEAVTAIVPQVLAKTGISADRVRAIGLTGQMHGTVLLNATHQPVHPSIIWADQRTADEVKTLIDWFGAEGYASLTGTLPATGFMVASLLWLARHQPDILEKSRHVILPKDYIRLKMTGEIGTDISDAAATGVFDVANGRWAEAIITKMGIDGAIFPRVHGSADVAGRLTPQAAELLGLKAGIPVIAGCADQPAQALTNGLISPGIASVTTGTGGQVFVPLALKSGEKLPTDPRLHVFNHAMPDRWYTLGAILSAGSALRWLRGVTGLANTPDAYAILSAEAAQVNAGSDGLIFLPYLVGERTPHMDPQARGAFIGLSDYHGRGHLARAVMEGVTFALKQTLDMSLSLAGKVETIIVSGGAVESNVWRGIQADVFGVPLHKTTQPEQTCVGAALLAGIGSGVYTDYESAVGRVAVQGHITESNRQNHARYSALYDHFIDLYPHLKP